MGKIVKEQQYESYWSYTAAYTDTNGKQFLSVLKGCISFFDRKNPTGENAETGYMLLQSYLADYTNIGSISLRKAINQLVKLGFLKPLMQGYIPLAKEYIKAKTDKKRQIILSKIVYQYSNFNNSMTKPDSKGNGQINFLIKTLEETGSIDNKMLMALMSIDIDKYPEGYISQEEMNALADKLSISGFQDRKYNQISHLKNLLSRLDNLSVHENAVYFKTDADRLFGDEIKEHKTGRDSYLQRVYKSELEDESTVCFGGNNPKCMLEGLAYPSLIASHIKPYRLSSDEEAFDVNNGLLLSRNMDALFDLGFISFDDKGKIVVSSRLDSDLKRSLSKYRLHGNFINNIRMGYMKYHRDHIFNP